MEKRKEEPATPLVKKKGPVVKVAAAKAAGRKAPAKAAGKAVARVPESKTTRKKDAVVTDSKESGGQSVYLEQFKKLTVGEKIAMIRKGVEKSALASLKETFELDYDQLSKILSSSRTVLINKKDADTFNQDISERIVALTELYNYGYDVFEDAATFNRWVKKDNRALGGKAPLELLDTLYGMNEVKHVIGRIDYGVFS